MEFANTISYSQGVLPLELLPVFCDIDDFCWLFVPLFQQQLIAAQPRQRQRASQLSLSEVMTIIVLFHASS